MEWPAALVFAVVALAGPRRADTAVPTDGFDVRVALRASWPPVPPRSAAIEWAKRLGTQAAVDALLGAGTARTGLGDAFGSLLLANRFFSPAVEAQRAACRALAARLLEGSLPCGGGPFAAVRAGGEGGPALRVACDVGGLEEAVRSPAAGGAAAELGRLSVDLPLRDEGLGAHNGTDVVLCGCVEDERLLPLVQWALRPRAARAEPLDAVYRQADCGGSGDAQAGELLSGYAVELRIKSGEYKATDDAATPHVPAADDAGALGDDDDAEEGSAVEVLEGVEVAGLRLDVLARRFPGLGRELVALREQLEAESGGSELARWELEDLGLRAAQRTTRSPEPLRTLASVTDSFPATMAALARQMTVKPRWRRALKKLRLAGVYAKQESMELNGQPLAPPELSLFLLLHRLEPQFAAAARLGKDAEVALAQWQQAGETPVGPATQPTRLDWRDAALKWCYHVRHDEEAEDWPVRLSALASSSRAENDLFAFGGRSEPKPLQVQQPIFSLVFVFDPLQASALDAAVELVRPSRPARVALLPVPNDPTAPAAGLARAVADAFGWLLRAGSKSDAVAARGFLQGLAVKPPASVADVEAAMQKQLPKARRGAASAWAKVEAAAASNAVEAYARAKGLAAPSLLLNGRVLEGPPQTLLQALTAAQNDEQATLTAAVSTKRLRDAKKPKDSEAQLEAFLLSGAVAATYDAALTPGLRVAAARVKDGTELLQQMGPAPHAAEAVEASTEPVATVLLPAELLEQLPSFGAGAAGAAEASASLLLFLRRPEHLPLLGYFSDFFSTPKASGLRLAVAVAPTEPCSPSCLQRGLGPGEALREAAACCEAEACKCAAAESTEAAEALWRELPAAVRARSGAVAVCNGQVVPDVPVSPTSPQLLVAHWCPTPVRGLALEAAAVAAAALVLQRGQPSEVFRRCAEGAPKALRVHLPPLDPKAPVLVEVAGTVDPLGDSTAAFAHLTQLLHSELNARVCVVLNPRESFEDYPLKKWQRHVYAPSSTEVEPWPAVFARLRTQHTLTLAMVCPPSWLVTAQASEHDLDNVRAVDAVGLVGSRPEITATFVLSRLYLEGSAHVEGSSNAATGLQLELLPAAGLGDVAGGCGVADTRVMQNRGFWSMPACPGAFEPALVPGASNETFLLQASEPVEVTSFVLPQLPLKVTVRPGRKEEDLARKTLGVRARRRARRAQLASPKAAGSCPTIHVFSLASGHLYERLLAIMMLSVRNHSACPLHFWLVSNFLSPRFTDLLPRLMADMEDVAYDLVSFKWPSWLNPQKEKQRLIWAYKILFLDVLFPMDVPRVIFVDSDLVVRADLRELWDLDLQGRPYGFTPFCSGEVELNGAMVQRKNNATTGFRFWDAGYWKNHLGKLPYHISALFVVDLLEFRRQSVGDQLRSTYNALTQDPSSLANLDQDLPNYAQHTVPIFSLPQEWLWCETWCSAETKPLAKAIDLCQNPSTKEPKTAMAQRVIGEWDAHHARVLALQQGAGPAASSRSSARDEL